MNQIGLHAQYDPNRLFDTLKDRYGITTDKTLSRKLRLPSHIIRQIRTGNLPLGMSILLSIAEATQIDLTELRKLSGDRRNKIRLSYPLNRSSSREIVLLSDERSKNESGLVAETGCFN
jgi:hypothetical protein